MNNNADNKPGVMIYFDIIPLLRPIARRLLLEAIMLCRQKINGNICVRMHRTCWQVIRDRRRA